MKSFKEFLESYKMPNRNLKSEIVNSALNCKGELISKIGSDELRKCDNFFTISDEGNVKFFQEYEETDEVLRLKARQKFTEERGMFSKFLITVLSSGEYKYVEDDEPHTADSVSSIERLLEGNRITIRVFDRFYKKEIPIEYSSKELLWTMDNVIRYYPNHNTHIAESKALKILSMFENPDVESLIYCL